MITLPYPPKTLNPNEPGHWAPKATAKKKYRAEACMLAKTHKPMTEFKVEFYPPHNRPMRNIDNAIASIKAGIDGLQDAWGIDDSEFIIHWPTQFSEVVKGGKVVITEGKHG